MSPSQDAFFASLPTDLTIDRSDAGVSAGCSDVFYVGSHRPLAILIPQSIAHIETIWRAANKFDISVINRGAGLSYTAAILPSVADAVILDLQRLNKILAPDIVDKFITVEAGATWLSVDQALGECGLRLALPAPISGQVSTVGGALAQGLPVGLEAVVGVEVVLPDGRLITIGAGHWGSQQTGCHRMMGADLLGVFLGTGGIFGTIARAHLRLEPKPSNVAYRSYTAENVEHCATLLTTLSQIANNVRLIAMPIRRERDAASISVGNKIKLAWNVTRHLKASSSLVKFFAQLLSFSIRPSNHKKNTACVHVVIEANSDTEAARLAAHLDAAAYNEGAHPVSSPIPAITYANPYSLRGMLGPHGERWVPIHGLGAVSQLSDFASITADFFCKHSQAMDREGISSSWLMMAWPGKCALIEPMFLWSAPLLPIHKLAGEIVEKVTVKASEETASRTAYVQQLREEIIAQLDEAGALHLQLGQSYPYRERLSQPLDDILTAVKNSVDPKCLSAPGNLGFSR